MRSVVYSLNTSSREIPKVTGSATVDETNIETISIQFPPTQSILQFNTLNYSNRQYFASQDKKKENIKNYLLSQIKFTINSIYTFADIFNWNFLIIYLTQSLKSRRGGSSVSVGRLSRKQRRHVGYIMVMTSFSSLASSLCIRHVNERHHHEKIMCV